MGADHIPVTDPGRQSHLLRAQLDAAIHTVLDSGWFVLGPQVDAFEREFAAYCGVEHCVAVGNGTDALELGLLGVGCRPGDEVLTVANAGMYATAACLKLGLRPRFSDVDPETLLMSVATFEEAVTPATRAVVVTHLYGQLADIEPIGAAARDRGILVLEDCAQAAGARRDGRSAGSFGDVAAFSFYPTKNLGALGDGGALLTDDHEMAQRLRALRQYGWMQKYRAELSGGRNSRLDELQAAILRVKLPYLDGWNRRRREIAARYRELASDDLRILGSGLPDDVAHLCVTWAKDRQALQSRLAAAGIGAAIHYPVPDHRQPVVNDSASLPISEQATHHVLSIPCFPEMTDEEVERVCSALGAGR